jgi:hypothetical protein
MANKTSIIVTTATAAVLLWPIAARAAKSDNAQPIFWLSNVTPVDLAGSGLHKPQITTDPRLRDWIRFSQLAKEWKQQRGTASSLSAMFMLPAYQSIIGMGDRVVPLIIAQMKLEGDDPDLWFWALSTITGANPVRIEDQGNFLAMSKRWIDWADKEYAW